MTGSGKITSKIHQFIKQAAVEQMSSRAMSSRIKEVFGIKISKAAICFHANKRGIELLQPSDRFKITPEIGDFVRMAVDAQMTQAGIIHYIKEFWGTDIKGPSLVKHISKDPELRAKIDANQAIRQQNNLAKRSRLSL